MPHFSKKVGMTLKFHHKKKRVKRLEWPQDQYYDILCFCEEYIFAKDQDGKLIQMNRDDNDNGWELVS